VEYEERESEFDIEDEDRTPARVKDDWDDEEAIVDVVTPHTISVFLSRSHIFHYDLSSFLKETNT